MDRAAPEEFAVLIPIVEHAGGDAVLLTKRPATLARYSGHVSFPGGARDPGDADLLATAIREAGEEVGIAPERIVPLGELPWFATGLGHRVKPFLARVAPGPITPSPVEVERVLYLPLAAFDRDPFATRTWTDERGHARSTFTLQLDGCEVWGLTARILRACFVEGLREGSGGERAPLPA
jgi:8-oxo-dGTP pyrophosphatase MutT (NUDIX family)